MGTFPRLPLLATTYSLSERCMMTEGACRNLPSGQKLRDQRLVHLVARDLRCRSDLQRTSHGGGLTARIVPTMFLTIL
eukprot:763858-Hanusia_phi.AAC.8